MTLLSATTLLILVMDPLGNVPLFLAAMNAVPLRRRRRVLLRELLVALTVLLAFLLAGPALLKALHISQPALGISGGVVLFLIALKMVFGGAENGRGAPQEEPFIVPLAIPFVAGPSAMATVLLLVSQHPHRRLEWLAALLIAWAASAAVLMAGSLLNRLLGRRGLLALERLMGMILIALAINMALEGVAQFIRTLEPG
jgi:multiple antibiotic resistance protein